MLPAFCCSKQYSFCRRICDSVLCVEVKLPMEPGTACLLLRAGRWGKGEQSYSTGPGAGLPLTKGGGVMPSTGTKQDKRRDPNTGRFLPGNKTGGRPRLPEELKEAFRAACPDALEVLKRILTNEGAKDSDRIRCAEIILDRGYGKPVQAVDLDGNVVPQVVIVGDVPD